MGLDRLPLVSPIIKSVGKAVGLGQSAPTPQPVKPTGPSAEEMAREDERRRLFSRGLGPTTFSGSQGDTSAANIGRRVLLGQ